MRQRADEFFFRDLRKEPLGRRQDLGETRGQFGYRQYLYTAPRNAGDARHLAQYLTVRPIPATPHDWDRADANASSSAKPSLSSSTLTET